MSFFVAIDLAVRPRDRGPLTIDDGSHAHAAVISAITSEDAELGRALHDLQRNKCIAIGIIEQPKAPSLLRLSFMAEEGLKYADLLITAFGAKPSLRIGRAICDVVRINMDQGSWSGLSTWADIMARSTGRQLRFLFATPTAIAKRSETWGRFFSLLPEPIDVFAGLARRWQALDGPPLPDDFTDFLKAGGCVISNHDLRTIEFRTAERTQIGFVGAVTYECQKSSQPHLQTLQSLTRLAFFTGVGYQTARGMGLTRTSIGE